MFIAGQKEIFRYGYVQENYSSSLSCDCEMRETGTSKLFQLFGQHGNK